MGFVNIDPFASSSLFGSTKSSFLAGQIKTPSISLTEIVDGQKELGSKKPGNIGREQSVYKYPQKLAEIPELMNFVSFEIYETGGGGLDSNKDSSLGSISSGLTPLVAVAPGVIAKATQLGKAAGGLLDVGSASMSALTGVVQTGTVGAFGALITSGAGKSMATNLYNSPSMGKLQGDSGVGWTQEITSIGLANKKVDKAIYLYLPGSVDLSYVQSYSDSDDMSGAQALVDIPKTTTNAIKAVGGGAADQGLFEMGAEYAEKMARGLSNTISDLASKATATLGLDKVNLKQYRALQTRQIPNPMLLSLFQNTSRRTFSLGYEFYPTSEKELDEVYNIIETFKKYSASKRSEKGRMLDFPAEFKLTFYYGTVENRYIPRLGRCALTSIKVKYGDKPFTTFKPNLKGAPPTKILMDLDFTELTIITQEEIEMGY